MARGLQIRDGLRAQDRFDEAGLLAVQLDDRALFLERWWRLLRDTLAHADDPALAALDRATARWSGRAGVDAVDYRLVRAFRQYVHEATLEPLLAPWAAHDADDEPIAPRIAQPEDVVWRLLDVRPAHLLPPRHDDWDALLHAAARRVVDELGDAPGGLAGRRWGEANVARVRHALSGVLPSALAGWLDMPAQPLPGDAFMPRVQGPAFGASERFAIAPGREEDALLHMPGGQSGHPLSPFHGAGHDDWARGDAAPLLAGEAVATLRLRATAEPERR